MLLYEVVTGRVPHDGLSSVEIIERFKTNFRFMVDEDCEFHGLFEMCTQTRPEDRPAMSDVVRWIEDHYLHIAGADPFVFAAYRAWILSDDNDVVLGTIENLVVAAQRSPLAMYVLAHLHYRAWAVEMDLDKVTQLLDKAAQADYWNRIDFYINLATSEVIPMSQEIFDWLEKK
jgi:hypothetical protein